MKRGYIKGGERRQDMTDEASSTEMDATKPGAARDETYDQAVAQAQKVEADLRARLAAQDRLDEAAPKLLEAAKMARHALGELRGGPHEEPAILRALCDAIACVGCAPD